jgi:hypothetical protein
MASIYGRLGFNFDTTKFNGADTLSNGAINYLSNTSIDLKQWQINDIANTTATGYYQNPHSTVLGNLVTVLNNIIVNSNTSSIIFDFAGSQADVLNSTANTTLTSISNFLDHTNRLSGIVNTTDASLYPDLNSGLSVGRQMLNITNKSDSVQNNIPIMGNFTSLYIGPDLNANYINITNDSVTLNNSLYVVDGNTSSNISNSQISVIISDVQDLQTLIDTRRTQDTTFYQNSLTVLNDYFAVLAFSNVGSTQNSLIALIGTEKLKTSLYSSS